MAKIKDTILDRQGVSSQHLASKRELWDNAEKLFHNQLNDAVSAGTKSQVFDPKLSTLTLERGYRVMAQLPTGKVKGISKNDIGASQLMNLILDKYVIPNANAQFDFLTKLRMADIYSNVYGNFFALIDWDVRKNGYIGPDMWLLNIRDVFPQVGAVSLNDSDYVIVRTWKPLSYFEGLKEQNGFKNINKIVTKLKDKAGSKATRPSKAKSERELSQYPEEVAAKKAGYYEVLTQFERDRWVDVCVDADMEFRDIANPHENGELPVACKYSIPLLDDFMGMGDFERGGSMQMAVNSVWNLYLDAVKMSIFPPVIINKDNVASLSSFKWGAAEKWLARGQIQNVAKTIELSPQGINQFNNTYQVANAAILNLFGTSDTTTTQQTDPGMGKTPRALSMQKERENTRDNADRFYMERFLKQIMTKMVNLISKKQPKAIVMRLFDEDIAEIERSYPEIRDLYDEKTGKVTIGKSKTGSILYDYEIVSGSTYAIDQKSQQDNLTMLMQLFLQSQTPQGNLLEQKLKEEGFNLKFGEIFKRVVSNSGIQDWDKILEEMTEEEKADNILESDQQKFMNILQQAQQGQGNMNQVPPEQSMQQGQPTEPPVGQGI